MNVVIKNKAKMVIAMTPEQKFQQDIDYRIYRIKQLAKKYNWTLENDDGQNFKFINQDAAIFKIHYWHLNIETALSHPLWGKTVLINKIDFTSIESIFRNPKEHMKEYIVSNYKSKLPVVFNLCGNEILINEEDLHFVLNHKWILVKDVYKKYKAFRREIKITNTHKKNIYLHKEIAQALDNEKVKFIDKNYFNLCRENLCIYCPLKLNQQ